MKNSTQLTRRAVVSCLSTATLWTMPAFAQTGRSYAVLSLVGDKLNVVTHLAVSGGNLDRNNHQEIALPDDAFDVAVARAVREALGSAAEVSLFSTRDPKVFALQDKLGSTLSESVSEELRSAARELLSGSKATHILLVTKHRGDMLVPLETGHIGDGKVSGIGYYIDQDVKVRNLETGVTSIGLLAPFAYLSMTLIDAATLRPLGQATAMRSEAYLTGQNKHAGIPWEILTPTEKVDALNSVIKRAVAETVPKVVGSR